MKFTSEAVQLKKIVLVVIILAATGIVKYYNSTHKPEASKTTAESSTKWKEDLQAQTDASKIEITKIEKIKTFIMFGLDFFQILVYVIVAFVISAISRSRSIATGFSLFLVLVGTGITQTLAMFFDWCKYLPFGLTNFKYFISAGSYIDGTSLGFALIVSAVYSVIFCFIGYYTFQKRDI